MMTLNSLAATDLMLLKVFMYKPLTLYSSCMYGGVLLETNASLQMLPKVGNISFKKLSPTSQKSSKASISSEIE